MTAPDLVTRLAVTSERRRTTNGPLVAGAILVASLVATAVASLLWTPYDPGSVNIASRFMPPGTPGHVFGTDQFGRDVLSQLMAGARTSLVIALAGSTLALIVGTLLGGVAATMGGLTDDLIARGSDLIYAFPAVLFALILAAKIGAGTTAAVVAIAVWSSPTVTRLARGASKSVFARDFVTAARAYGRSRWYILVRHVLPNIVGVLVVQLSIMFALAIIIEAGLAFIGVGSQPPASSWGRMLREAHPFLQTYPLLSLWPGVAIMLSVLGFNLLGDGLRDRLDVRGLA